MKNIEQKRQELASRYQKDLQELNTKIDTLCDQYSAIVYALELVKKEHANAVDMVENVPSNIYIEDWKAKAQSIAKKVELIEGALLKMSQEIDRLYKERDNLERNRQYEEEMLNEWERQQQEKAKEPKQKGYVIKYFVTNLKNNDFNIYYRGVDGYIQTDPNFCDPYKRKGQLLNIIKKEAQEWGRMSGGELLDETNYIHNGYLYELSLIEVER